MCRKRRGLTSRSARLLLGCLLISSLIQSRAEAPRTFGFHFRHRSQAQQEGSESDRRQEEAGSAVYLRAHDESYGLGENATKAQKFDHVCKLMGEMDRMVLAAGEKYDLTWLRELEIPYIQYQSSDSSKPHFYEDNANEGGAYTQFIHDYYDCLPKMVAFVHGHGGSGWHFDDMTEVLRRVDWETGPNFIDINRNPNDTVHLLGDAPARPPNPIAWGADAYNGGHSTHQIIGGIAYESFTTHLWLLDQSYTRFYDKHLGPEGFGEIPGSIRVTCCAQFVVRREAIRLRTRDFYKRTLDYLAANDLRANNRWDRKYVVGDATSVFWSMIFGAANSTPMRDCSEYSRDKLPARCA